MSNETHSPVKLVTAAYLDPSYFAEEPAVPETAKTQDSSQTAGLERAMRVLSFVVAITLIAAFLSVAPTNSMKIGSTKKDRRWSASDWTLWAAGAKKSKIDKLYEKIEQNRKVSLTPPETAKVGKDSEFDQKSRDQKQLTANEDPEA